MVKKSKKRVVKKVAKKKAIKVLPKKLSSLIKLALADMRKAEKVPEKYILALDNTYHTPTEVICSTTGGDEIKRQKACVICAAGAVMAFTLKADISKELSPISMGANADALSAIDHLRGGGVSEAYGRITTGDSWSDAPEKVRLLSKKFYGEIPEYDRANPEPFHKAMKKLEAALVKIGL